MPPVPPPDIGLLGAEWQARALIRAQLIEEGFDVIATRTWPMLRRSLRPGSKPRLVIVDLKGLPNPRDVLTALSVLMTPSRVLIVAASGTVRVAEIERFGFRVLARPLAIENVVEAAVKMIEAVDRNRTSDQGS